VSVPNQLDKHVPTVRQNTIIGVFFFFNLLQFITGIAAIVAGSLNWESENQEYHNNDILNNGLYSVLVTTGVLTLILTFVGCLGAFKKNKYILFGYGGLNLVLMLVHISVVLVLIVYALAGGLATVILDWMNDCFQQYGQGNTEMDLNIDDIQEASECCGTWGYKDWEEYPYNGVGDGCCVNRTVGCGLNYFVLPDQLRPDIWMTGCAWLWLPIMQSIIAILYFIIGAIIGGLALVQVICSSLALTLGCQAAQRKTQSTMVLHPM
ncbi:unnamed protein product, partial [Meganyctiphanes norvegica]